MINLKDAHLKPQPMPDADSDIYWRGIQEGKLLLQHCPACGHVQLYQQAICRECGSERLEHRAASGRAKVHSFSVVHRAPGPPGAGAAPLHQSHLSGRRHPGSPAEQGA